MKNALVPLVAALTLLLFTGPAAAQTGAELEKFKKDFEQALSLNDGRQMADLVRRNHDAAVYSIVATCEAIGRRSSEKLERRIDAYRTAWRDVHGTRFVDWIYEYLALMTTPIRDHRAELHSSVQRTMAAYGIATESEDVHAFPGISAELVDLAEAYENVGDYYHSSRCWLIAALCYEEDALGPKADYKKVWELFGHFLAAREKIDLRDSTYATNKARREELAAAGFGDEPVETPPDAVPEGKGGVGKPRGKGPLTPSTPPGVLGAGMMFELIDSVEAFEVPAYDADIVFPLWNVTGLGERGSTERLWTIEPSPTLIRETLTQVNIDVDGDGVGEIEVPLSGNIETVEIPLGQGDDARPWAMRMAVANDRRTYQGIQMNMAPQQDGVWLYFTNAASVVGELAGTPLRVIDGNMDGVYGSLPREWEFLGLGQGQYYPQVDSVIFGKGKKAVPWSQFQKLGDEWYQFEQESNGLVITAKPQPKMKTGRLRLKTKGLKPDFLVVKGSGKWQDCYFDVTEGGSKGLEVPNGKYSIYYGLVRKGKREQTMKAMILQGDSKVIDVKVGETATLELGAPYTFDFAYQGAGEVVTISGKTINVKGKAGELYDRVWNAVVRPEVSLRKKGAKKGGKGKKMRVVQNQNEMPSEGYGAMFRPLDLVLSTKKVGEAFEVNLYEKKNKLFGTIESEWK